MFNIGGSLFMVTYRILSYIICGVLLAGGIAIQTSRAATKKEATKYVFTPKTAKKVLVVLALVFLFVLVGFSEILLRYLPAVLPIGFSSLEQAYSDANKDTYEVYIIGNDSACLRRSGNSDEYKLLRRLGDKWYILPPSRKHYLPTFDSGEFMMFTSTDRRIDDIYVIISGESGKDSVERILTVNGNAAVLERKYPSYFMQLYTGEKEHYSTLYYFLARKSDGDIVFAVNGEEQWRVDMEAGTPASKFFGG
jgi:hypothetical protein